MGIPFLSPDNAPYSPVPHMGNRTLRFSLKKDAKPAASGDEGPSLDDLEQRVAALEREKMEEEKLRNYFQLERDKISSFWEITKKELEERKAELRNKDREMEEMEERHQASGARSLACSRCGCLRVRTKRRLQSSCPAAATGLDPMRGPDPL